MLKQTLVAGIMGLGFLVSAPVMAHGNNNYHNHDYQRIQPVRHCVPGHKVNNRQAKQQKQIQNGKHSGKLVKWELRELRQQQKNIRHAEHRMRSDGCLTRNESQRLIKRLNRAGNRIKQLKQNHVRRGYRHNNRHRSDRNNRH